MSLVKVQITNTYASRSNTEVVDVEAPDSLEEPVLADWWEDEVFPHTGDGKGGDACYEAKVVYVEDLVNLKDLAGQAHEWIG